MRPLSVWSAVLVAALAVTLLLLPMLLLWVPSPRVPRATSRPVVERPTDTPDIEEPGSPPAPEVDSPMPPSAPLFEPQPLNTYAPPPATQPISAQTRPAEAAAAQLPLVAQRRNERVARFGGNAGTENAVEAGLVWLAAHQDGDGGWDRFGFARHCPRGDECPGPALTRTGVSLDAGLTGLCLLAFLGAGYNDRDGPHAQTVARAVAALCRAQQDDGGFGGDEKMAGYNNALATFALAESYAATRDGALLPVLSRAAAKLAASQQKGGGWDYIDHPDSGRNDTSIAAWMVQALAACDAAGVAISREALVRATLHFVRAAGSDGRVWYADAGTGFRIERESAEPAYRYGSAMTAAGAASTMLLGFRPGAALVQQQQALLLGDPPSLALLQGGDPTQLHDYYYWYYGTVALFQVGEGPWERWNAALRDAVLTMQERAKRPDGTIRSHTFGSWPPYGENWGKWGRMGSRVYTTALCTLTLEIYYRKTPAYLENPSLVTATDWRGVLLKADAAQRRLGLRALGQLRVEIGEPVLVELLSDEEREIARGAALALVDVGSPAGITVLESAARDAPPSQQRMIQRALDTARASRTAPAPRGRIRLYDAETRLATVELPGAYVGLKLRVLRDGKRAATMGVIQRFGESSIAIAEVVGAADAPPQPGDAVVGE